MKVYQKRMLEEYMELRERIDKLSKFIDTNDAFAALETDEQEDMRKQLYAMRLYMKALMDRCIRQGIIK